MGMTKEQFIKIVKDNNFTCTCFESMVIIRCKDCVGHVGHRCDENKRGNVMLKEFVETEERIKKNLESW